MRQKHSTPFEITGMDSLGQGVSKVTDKVTFIPKTTVGDKGEAQIMSEKKGVAFARVIRMDTLSDERVEPFCSHFSTCPSCHYQHISYDSELKYKKESFERLFRKVPLPAIELIAAPQRSHYRNRIQLHYSIKSKLLGMKDPLTFEIIPIPNCLIGVAEILQELTRLYHDQNWMKLVPEGFPEGHVELYWKENHLQLSWNKPYSEGGFTQVYGLMNERLKGELTSFFSQTPLGGLLDLFGGNGNLSEKIAPSKRLCVDNYKAKKGSDFFNQDLYAFNALKNIKHAVEARKMDISHLIIDPPRSGFKEFSETLKLFTPQIAAYVSCDPHTLARDLQSLEDYEIKKAFLIDFFPSTFHFESMIFLQRKK
jgi:23S rRNA (uracil1939-C5)-methyltransferase